MMLEIIIITQIIFESLPVSSSSHVRLVEMIMDLFGMQMLIPVWVDPLLHGSTILILMIFFRREWWGVIKVVRTKRGRTLLAKLIGLVAITSLLPILFLYGVVQPYIKDTVLFESPLPMLGGLIITTLILFSLKYKTDDVRQTSYNELPVSAGTSAAPHVSSQLASALLLGVVQALALLPGISRFASTYGAARWLNIKRSRAFQICFLIQFPLIVAAFFVNGLRGLIKSGAAYQLFSWSVCVSVLVATLVSYAMLCCMFYLAQKNRLWYMGWYMLVPIVTLVLLMLV